MYYLLTSLMTRASIETSYILQVLDILFEEMTKKKIIM